MKFKMDAETVKDVSEVKKLVESNSEQIEDIVNGINSGNYGIMSYYIRFYYYSYYYGENEYTTFDFIDTNDDLNRAYPIHDYWGI